MCVCEFAESLWGSLPFSLHVGFIVGCFARELIATEPHALAMICGCRVCRSEVRVVCGRGSDIQSVV